MGESICYKRCLSSMEGYSLKRIIFLILILCYYCHAQETKIFEIQDLGKVYELNEAKLMRGLFHHIEDDKDVIGGNTSIRNIAKENLVWKGNPDSNGYGYFQRNRDLGQVFTVPTEHNVILDALVVRTSKGNNAIMEDAPKARLYINFYEVRTKSDEVIRINENGTTKGEDAAHGFDHQFNRADDFIEGDLYFFLHHFVGGIFPQIEPTTQFTYNTGNKQPFGEQEGHLRYFRCDFRNDSEILLEGGKTYAFLIGFSSPASNRGLALAIDTEVHTKEASEFLHDELGNIRWGIRREGNGTLPPTMIKQGQPPSDNEKYLKLVSESLFPSGHQKTMTPTSNGYPDVDTYRTLQFYLEAKEIQTYK